MSVSGNIPLKTEALNKLLLQVEGKSAKSVLVWQWVQDFIKTDAYKKMPKDGNGDLKFANSPMANTEGKHYSVLIGANGCIYDEIHGIVYRSAENFATYSGVDFVYEQIVSDQVYTILVSNI